MQSAQYFNSLYAAATAQKQLIPVVPGWLQDGGGPPREIIQPPHTAIVATTSVRIKTNRRICLLWHHKIFGKGVKSQTKWVFNESLDGLLNPVILVPCAIISFCAMPFSRAYSKLGVHNPSSTYPRSKCHIRRQSVPVSRVRVPQQAQERRPVASQWQLGMSTASGIIFVQYNNNLCTMFKQ